MIRVLTEESKTETQSLQAARNPTCAMTSIKNGHETELKAREMSTLSRSDGWLLAFKVLATDYTYLKLS
jgi:hypothetical protein